jgi:hypothetical protein
MKDLTEHMKDYILPDPKRPPCRREVKIKPTGYPLKKPERLRKEPKKSKGKA